MQSTIVMQQNQSLSVKRRKYLKRSDMISKVKIIMGVAVLIGVIIILVRIGLYFMEIRADKNDSLKQAKQMAKEYLEEEHQKEMVYVKHTSVYDKMIWSITFSAVDDPEHLYTVSIYEGYDRASLPIKKHFTVQSVTIE